MENRIESTKTAVLRGKEQLSIEERKLPVLDENSVLVQVLACNVCTSEYGVYDGSRTSRPTPLVFGHEWSGRVLETGAKVMALKEGDFVACGYQFDPYSPESMEGRTGECRHIVTANDQNPDGYYGNAGFAEYAVKSQVGLYKIREGIDPAVAGLLEPIASVVYGMRKLAPKRGDAVAVIGAGTMGILNALIAREYGCNVIISELLEKKIETAQRCGFSVIDGAKQDAVSEVGNRTDGRGADAVVLAVGAQPATDQAFEMLKPKRGKVLLFAASYPSPVITPDVNTLHYRKIDMIGTFGADHQDFVEAARLINSGMDFSAVIETRIPFEQMEEAMRAACVPGAYRVCVTM